MKQIIRYLSLSIFIAMAFIIYFKGCSSITKKEISSSEKIQFLVSDEIKSKFPIFENSLNDPKSIFLQLREAAENVCAMAHNQKQYNDKTAREFININGLQVTDRGVIWNLLPRVIAGCWNYFQMNDIHPEKEFQLIRALYPTEKKECYSVGFMQPYIMNEILGCSKINMLDIDWRIHFTHFELIQKIKSNSFQKENINTSLQAIPFDWVAFNSSLKINTSLRMEDVCKTDPNTCINAIIHFQSDYKRITDINLQLAPLHDLSLQPDLDSISIIYASNALDTVYTKMNELRKMLSKINSGLGRNQVAIIIYHNGGLSMYGIYEVSKDKDFPKIRTICKDSYYIGGVSETEKTFINLDKLSSNNGRVVTCSGLHKEKVK